MIDGSSPLHSGHSDGRMLIKLYLAVEAMSFPHNPQKTWVYSPLLLLNLNLDQPTFSHKTDL